MNSSGLITRCVVPSRHGVCRTPPLTPHEAVSMLFAQGRQRYDAGVLNAFIRMMGVYPAGSLVQLTDDRFAMVIGVNGSRPLKPRVLVHDPKVPAHRTVRPATMRADAPSSVHRAASGPNHGP
jgi:hypothetical protein